MRRIAVLFLLVLAGCSPQLPSVRLGELDPTVPEVRVPDSGEALVVAVAGMLSPRASEPYRRLAAALAEKLGRDVVVLQRRTYADVLELLREGTAQVGFLCTLAAGKGVSEGYLRAVAAGVPYEYAPYRSVILTRADMQVRGLEDLANRRFAFVDPLSNTGFAWPQRYFRNRGVDARTFFSQTVFTYSHDRSIRALLDGFVDAAAVDGIVYFGLLKDDPGLERELRVLWESPEDPPPPLVVRSGLPQAQVNDLLAALTSLDKSLLSPLHIARFTPTDSAPYRRVWTQFLEEPHAAP
ncbi:PhnD/SsuA/transferrin family substrate-binding protein [Oceanithermus desulfurans]|uniref:Phosphonate ABC transporter substrate-binding protein n=2 Tax=Oceanithermus desulfurans TaxID=227924 RepID=A0A511RJI4_9DEIN|nr:PhnD/SsuA/transferrin family substrate-binding protein [Oceanithermus desulfurans]MBB6029853.1 phosphonate transport system substrate-binding protein [Oceanithermus desulfurans]GEM89814.1 phosphonate ABC transporter substrate-binding protein [Oceanithermus desulfurans NBRC 100063]